MHKEKRLALLKYLSQGNCDTIDFLCDYFSSERDSTISLIIGFYKENYTKLVSDIANNDGNDGQATTLLIKTIVTLEKEYKRIISFFNQEKAIAEVIENSSHPIEAYYTLFDTADSYIDFLCSIKVKCLKNIDDFMVIHT